MDSKQLQTGKFSIRECFSPRAQRNDSNKCVCGRHIGHGIPNFQNVFPGENDRKVVAVKRQESKEIKWNRKQHTINIPKQVEGELVFQETETKANFIRFGFEKLSAIDECDKKKKQQKVTQKEASVDWKGLVEKISRHLYDKWKLCEPEIIISVAGGNAEIHRELKESIRKGITNVLMERNSWLITNGVNDETTRLISEPVYKFHDTKPQETAKSKSGKHSNSKLLEAAETSKSDVELIGITTWGTLLYSDRIMHGFLAEQSPIKIPPEGQDEKRVQLEPHHEHLLLVDDGTEGYIGREIRLRVALLKHMTSGGNVKTTIDKKSPKNGMEQPNETGGSQAISENFDSVHGPQPETNASDDTQQPSQEKIVPSVLIAIGSDRFTLRLLRKCIKENIPVIVINGISAIITRLKAVDEKDGEKEKREIEKTKEEMEKWEQFSKENPEAIRKFLYSFDTQNDKDFDEFICEVFLKAQLAQNGGLSKQYISQLALEFDSADFLSENVLIPQKKSEPTKIESILNDQDKKQVHDFLIVFLKKYCMKKITMENLSNDCYRDAFLSAVINNKQRCAEILWKKTTDLMGSAIFASVILDYMAKARINEAEKSSLVRRSQHFENCAYEVLDVCHTRNSDVTQFVLTMNSPDNGLVWSPIKMASFFKKTRFMTHPACLKYITQVWHGQIKSETPWWKLLLAILCPFPFSLLLAPVLLEYYPKTLIKELYPKKEKSRDEEQNSQTENSIENSKPLTLPPGRKIDLFFHAPLVIFGHHSIAYVVFLALFSYFVMVELSPQFVAKKAIIEIILMVWVGTFILEEIRSLKKTKSEESSIGMFLKQHFTVLWNVADVALYLLYIVALILRFTLNEDRFQFARAMYSVALIGFGLRILQHFHAFKSTGKTIIMMETMIRKDLKVIILIALVFIFSYGVALQAIRHPQSPLTWGLVKDVLFIPYWHMYGELFMDDEEFHANAFVDILLFFYMLLVALMLLNLIIAMFSTTYSQIEENSVGLWWSRRRNLVMEYQNKPFFPPPLCLFCYIFWAVLWCYKASKEKSISTNLFDDMYNDRPLNEDDVAYLRKKLTTFVEVTTEVFGQGEKLKPSRFQQAHSTKDPSEQAELLVGEIQRRIWTNEGESMDASKMQKTMGTSTSLTSIDIDRPVTWARGSSKTMSKLRNLAAEIDHGKQAISDLRTDVEDLASTMQSFKETTEKLLKKILEEIRCNTDKYQMRGIGAYKK